MKINFTKKQRFVISIIILAVLLFLTRSKSSDSNVSVPASATETSGVITHFVPEPALAVRVVFLAVAVLVMCFASSLYMTSNLGVSVYDAIPIVIAEKRGFPFKFVRIACDLLCVIIGTLAGLMPGVGTLITAFFMGPLIEFFNYSFSEPFLNR